MDRGGRNKGSGRSGAPVTKVARPHHEPVTRRMDGPLTPTPPPSPPLLRTNLLMGEGVRIGRVCVYEFSLLSDSGPAYIWLAEPHWHTGVTMIYYLFITIFYLLGTYGWWDVGRMGGLMAMA
jgi:hypothetical protein